MTERGADRFPLLRHVDQQDPVLGQVLGRQVEELLEATEGLAQARNEDRVEALLGNPDEGTVCHPPFRETQDLRPFRDQFGDRIDASTESRGDSFCRFQVVFLCLTSGGRAGPPARHYRQYGHHDFSG